MSPAVPPRVSAPLLTVSVIRNDGKTRSFTTDPFAGTTEHSTNILITEASKLEPPPKKEQAVKIQADERVCSGCGEATLMGTVEQNGNNGWRAVSDLGFRLDSSSGETARLAP